ncbi:unnamed protein product [Rhizophagus irregularis]|nr:unnamed protein product [Rhizophagus irregularis]
MLILWTEACQFGYRSGIGFALDQLVSASRLWIFQIGINFRTLDLIGFMFLDFNRYRLWVFGFDRYRLWVFRFWISWLRVFEYFRSVSTLGLWILDRYRLQILGFIH